MALSLATHHRVALVAAAATSGIALFDAVTHGFTGDYSAFSDDSEVVALLVTGDVVHGLTYAALGYVLVREAGHIDRANRAARVLRWLLLAALATLAVGFLLLAPTHLTGGSERFTSSFGIVVGPAFALMFVAGVGLGLSLLRSPRMRYGAVSLAGVIPVLGLTALVAWLAPGFAHPAYAETAIHFGVALLGARLVTTSTLTARTAPESVR